MPETRLDRAEIESDLVPDPVPYAAIVPEGGEPLPLCLLLHGGDADREALVAQKPLLDALFDAGTLPPMVVATASTGAMSFYLDRPDGGGQWERFIAEAFLEHLRETYPVRRDAAGTLLTGASMGGLGSLKIAFRHPERFAAVAAMQPPIEPALRHEDTRSRNRFFYAQAGNELLGDARDPAFWEANNPASRAVANADAIRESGLQIYLEVGDEDVLNVQDGAEFLHRVLWDLDIPHEYHLVRGADHVGPSLTRRLVESLGWLGDALRRANGGSEPALSAEERAWVAWAEAGFAGAPPDTPLDPTSPALRQLLRAQLAPYREQAASRDPTMARRLGKLPPTG